MKQIRFYFGVSLYIIPSDMDIYIGTIDGYNNIIVITSPDEIKSIQSGQNNVNDAPVISKETFETPQDDFSFEDEPVDETVIPQDHFEDEPIISQSFKDDVKKNQNIQLKQDETKLVIKLSGIIGGSFLIWYISMPLQVLSHNTKSHPQQ